jgi:HEAT repeat protein
MFGNNLEKIEKLGQKGKGVKALPYATSRKAEERAAAATALGSATDDDSYNALIILLRDPDMKVCISAAGALKNMGRKAATEHLRHIADNSTDETFKAACYDAVASLSRNGK